MGLLDGRVVIVTGGGRGIGRAHCLELARQGAAVVIADPGVDLAGGEEGSNPAAEVVAEIERSGGRALALDASVTDWASVSGVVGAAVSTFGRLDGVVNNAGILRDRMITSMSEDEFDAVVAVHLKGTFVVTKHACDHWRVEAKAGKPVSGRIVNTTSGAGLAGSVGQAAYSAAKAGIVGLTLTTALEMGRYNVTCNAISPIARTRMTAGLPALGEGGDVDPYDPAASSPVVAYLLSEAAGWLSGQVLRVEGGTVIRMDGWRRSDARHSAPDGGLLDAVSLVDGVRRAYGAHPLGVGG